MLVSRIYLTYEELKPGNRGDRYSRTWPDLSYLWGIETPEVWLPRCQLPRIYLTYEELKQGKEGRKAPLFMGSILPMRNWNFPWVQIKGGVMFGSILPMRNWNSISFLFVGYSNTDLSYLWGIETYLAAGCFRWNIDRIYLTYEELKPILSSKIHCHFISDLSYLWGIETESILSEAPGKTGIYLTYEELKLDPCQEEK